MLRRCRGRFSSSTRTIGPKVRSWILPPTRMLTGRAGASLSVGSGESRSCVTHRGRRFGTDEELDATPSRTHPVMAVRTRPHVPVRADGRGSGELTRRTRFLSYAGVVEVLVWWARKPPI